MPSVPAICRGGPAWAFQSKTEKEKQAWSSCDASTNRSSGLFESRSRSNFDPQPDKDRNAAAFGGSGLSSCITLQHLFRTDCFIPRFDLGLLVQNHVQQGTMDFQFSVVFDKTQLRNLFMKKLTRDRVVPIISASVS